jgi:hypothetical protein
VIDLGLNTQPDVMRSLIQRNLAPRQRLKLDVYEVGNGNNHLCLFEDVQRNALHVVAEMFNGHTNRYLAVTVIDTNIQVTCNGAPVAPYTMQLQNSYVGDHTKHIKPRSKDALNDVDVQWWRQVDGRVLTAVRGSKMTYNPTTRQIYANNGGLYQEIVKPKVVDPMKRKGRVKPDGTVTFQSEPTQQRMFGEGTMVEFKLNTPDSIEWWSSGKYMALLAARPSPGTQENAHFQTLITIARRVRRAYAEAKANNTSEAVLLFKLCAVVRKHLVFSLMARGTQANEQSNIRNMSPPTGTSIKITPDINVMTERHAGRLIKLPTDIMGYVVSSKDNASGGGKTIDVMVSLSHLNLINQTAVFESKHGGAVTVNGSANDKPFYDKPNIVASRIVNRKKWGWNIQGNRAVEATKCITVASNAVDIFSTKTKQNMETKHPPGFLDADVHMQFTEACVSEILDIYFAISESRHKSDYYTSLRTLQQQTKLGQHNTMHIFAKHIIGTNKRKFTAVTIWLYNKCFGLTQQERRVVAAYVNNPTAETLRNVTELGQKDLRVLYTPRRDRSIKLSSKGNVTPYLWWRCKQSKAYFPEFMRSAKASGVYSPATLRKLRDDGSREVVALVGHTMSESAELANYLRTYTLGDYIQNSALGYTADESKIVSRYKYALSVSRSYTSFKALSTLFTTLQRLPLYDQHDPDNMELDGYIRHLGRQTATGWLTVLRDVYNFTYSDV